MYPMDDAQNLVSLVSLLIYNQFYVDSRYVNNASLQVKKTLNDRCKAGQYGTITKHNKTRTVYTIIEAYCMDAVYG